MGNELNAVILQTVLCAILGAGFAAASVVWELDSWSLAKQSGIYFLIISIIMLPIAYFANWMKHSLAGVLSYAGIFTAIFVVVWISQYLLWKQNIKRMNAFVSEEAKHRRKCAPPQKAAGKRSAGSRKTVSFANRPPEKMIGNSFVPAGTNSARHISFSIRR